MASYQEIAARYDAANQRIDGLLTLTSTVTLAAPIVVAAAGGDPDFRSPALIAAVVLFSAALLVGAIARGFAGKSRLIGPSSLYADWLGLSPSEFKLNGIYWAGEHFRQTADAIWRKSWAAHAMTVLFLAEGIALLVWVWYGAVRSAAHRLSLVGRDVPWRRPGRTTALLDFPPRIGCSRCPRRLRLSHHRLLLAPV